MINRLPMMLSRSESTEPEDMLLAKRLVPTLSYALVVEDDSHTKLTRGGSSYPSARCRAKHNFAFSGPLPRPGATWTCHTDLYTDLSDW